jgi:hypothetical protein
MPLSKLEDMSSAINATDFFSRIEPFDNFEDTFDPSRYHPLPADWLVAVCDIQGSTAGIRDGKYKEVNMTGASAIIAVLNATRGREIPYVFGGDGASFALPPDAANPVAAALMATREMAAGVFGLTLRAGIIPAADVRAAGHDIRVARYRLSEKVAIAMFNGGGISCAEGMIKDPVGQQKYDVSQWTSSPPSADFGGLECRWNPLKTVKGQIVTLIVRVTKNDDAAVYRELFYTIRRICGPQEDYRPARQNALSLSFQPENLKRELGVRAYGGSFSRRVFYAMKMWWENILGTTLLGLDMKVAGMDGTTYRRDLVLNTDFQKFDDALRMVLDSTPAQTAELLEYLNLQYNRGRLFYGMHVEQEALITCLIFNRNDKHLHFIDGARGGYGAAATSMKEQMKHPG